MEKELISEKYFIFVLGVLFVSIFSFGLVLAQNDGSDNGNSGNARVASVGSGDAVGIVSATNQVEVRTREGENGVVQNTIQSRNVEAVSDIQLEGGYGGGNSGIQARLSDGQVVEVKVLPDVAVDRAREALRINSCSEDNSCSVRLKESLQEGSSSESGNIVRAVYEVRAQKTVRVFGVFSAKMDSSTEIDATDGEVVNVKNPWWSVFAIDAGNSAK